MDDDERYRQPPCVGANPTCACCRPHPDQPVTHVVSFARRGGAWPLLRVVNSHVHALVLHAHARAPYRSIDPHPTAGARAAAGRIASAWGSGVGERREAGGGGEGAEGGGRKRPRGLADDETIL